MTVKKDTQRGTWFFVVDLPPKGGKRQQLKRRGFATKKEALAAERATLTDHSRGTWVRPKKGTLTDYLTNVWLPIKQAGLRRSTHASYDKTITSQIIPHIGDVQLSQLDTITLQRFYAFLLEKGGVKGQGLAPKTVANTNGIISKALTDAVEWSLIPYNPAKSITIKRDKRPEQKAWTEREAAEFLAAIREDPRFPFWRLALATGMRRGELCGLRWSAVDLEAGRIRVRSARVEVRGGVEDGDPKTDKGRRWIAIDRETVAVLSAWRAKTLEMRLRAGPAAPVDDFVVVKDDLMPPGPGTVTKWWNDALASAGIPPIRLHDARHTMATVLLRAGVPLKVVSERLGHADVTVTMAVYQHVTIEDDQNAAEVVERLFGATERLVKGEHEKLIEFPQRLERMLRESVDHIRPENLVMLTTQENRDHGVTTAKDSAS